MTLMKLKYFRRGPIQLSEKLCLREVMPKKIISKSDRDIVLKKYPSSEEHLTSLASSLTRRKRYEDAIRLLKLNLDIYPVSVSSFDNISKIYKLTGDKKKADFYSNKAGEIIKESVKNAD